MRILLIGASGTIGRATLAELLRRGHDVVALARPGAQPVLEAAAARGRAASPRRAPGGLMIRPAALADPAALERDGVCGERFDALVSCLASRTGTPRDAWAIDHAAHVTVLAAAQRAGVSQVVLLSAICVQRPKLAFQHAKLAFEAHLAASGVAYSIVRPTAFFKSLSGQVERVRRGKPFLVFGDGRLTACKPISDGDLAAYLADCLEDPARRNRILPIGGPGPAITPLEQGECLFRLLGRAPRFRHVPVALLDAIVSGLALGGRIVPALADKAEYARIGRYYATESMLVWDAERRCYDADATPSTGTETLFGHYARLVQRGPAQG